MPQLQDLELEAAALELQKLRAGLQQQAEGVTVLSGPVHGAESPAVIGSARPAAQRARLIPASQLLQPVLAAFQQLLDAISRSAYCQKWYISP